MNQSRCDQNNNKAGSLLHIPIHTRGHAGGARTRPADRSFMSSAATPTHLPKVGARCTCVLRMQLGHRPGPGASQGLFLPLVPRDAGMRREGGDPAWRGSAAALLKDNVQDRGTGPAAPPGRGSWGCSGVPCSQAGAGASLRRETSHPRAFAPHGLPSSQRKAGVRRIRTWELCVGCPPRTLGARVCHPHGSTHPPPELPSRLFGKGTAWKGTNPKDTIIFPAINGSVIHLGSRIIKAGMLSSWIHRIPATRSPLFPTGFITLQLPSFIPLSVPGWSFAVPPAQRWEGFPAPDVQRYLGEYQ